MRVNHRERLIKQHGRHIRAHQAAAKRDFLLGICRQVGGALVELAAHFQHFGNHAHALLDLVGGPFAVTQRKRQVFGHRHGVVNHRKLKNLRNIALLRAALGDVLAVKLDAAVRRRDQPGHDVEQGGFAAARGPEQRVGAAIFKRHLQGQQGVVAVLLGVGPVGVGQVEFDACHINVLCRAPGLAAAGLGRQTHTPARG